MTTRLYLAASPTLFSTIHLTTLVHHAARRAPRAAAPHRTADAESHVLVFWTAKWCGPCRIMSGVVKDVDEAFPPDKLKVYEVNCDDEQDLAQEWGIEAIPTLVVYKNGEE